MMDIELLCNRFIRFEPDPEAMLVSSETVGMLMNAIDRLPPKGKLIFKLIKEDGLKYKDVATLLNLSVKTVEAQLSNALKKISQRIKTSANH